MAASRIFEIFGAVTVNNDQANANLLETQKLADNTSKSMGKSFDTVGNKIVNTGAKVTALTAPLTIFSTISLASAGNFEEAMNRVAAISQANTEELERMSAAARIMGADTRYSATEAADALGYLVQAGYKANEAIIALPETLNLATAGGLDLSEAANIATATLTGFGLEVTDLARVNDILAKTAADTNTDVRQMGYAFSYAGPIAKSAGKSIEETATIIGLLANAGIKGERGGTALRGALVRLLRPPKMAADALAELNVQVNDSEGNMLSLAEIFRQLEDAGADTADMVKIFGTEAAPGMIAVLEAGSDTIQQMTADMENAEGAAQQMADTMGRGLNYDVDEFRSVVEELSLAIGDAGLLRDTSNFVQQMTEFVRMLTKANPETLYFVTKVAGITLALGPALALFGQFVVLLGAVLSPLGFITAGLIAAAAAFVYFRVKGLEAGEAVAEIQKSVEEIRFDEAQARIDATLKKMEDYWFLVSVAAKAALATRDAIKTTSSFVQGVDQTFTRAENRVRAFGQALIDVPRDMVAGFINGIMSRVNQTEDAVVGFFGQIVRGVKDFLMIRSPSGVFEDIGNNVVQGFINGVIARAKDAQAALAQMFGFKTESQASPFDAIVKSAPDVVKANQDIQGELSKTSEFFIDLGTYIRDQFGPVMEPTFKAIVFAAKIYFANLIFIFNLVILTLQAFGVDIISLREKVETNFQAISDAGGVALDALGKALNVFGNVFNTVTLFIERNLSDIISTLSSVLNNAVGIVSDNAAKIADAVLGMFGTDLATASAQFAKFLEPVNRALDKFIDEFTDRFGFLSPYVTKESIAIVAALTLILIFFNGPLIAGLTTVLRIIPALLAAAFGSIPLILQTTIRTFDSFLQILGVRTGVAATRVINELNRTTKAIEVFGRAPGFISFTAILNQFAQLFARVFREFDFVLRQNSKSFRTYANETSGVLSKIPFGKTFLAAYAIIETFVSRAVGLLGRLIGVLILIQTNVIPDFVDGFRTGTTEINISLQTIGDALQRLSEFVSSRVVPALNELLAQGDVFRSLGALVRSVVDLFINFGAALGQTLARLGEFYEGGERLLNIGTAIAATIDFVTKQIQSLETALIGMLRYIDPASPDNQLEAFEQAFERLTPLVMGLRDGISNLVQQLPKLVPVLTYLAEKFLDLATLVVDLAIAFTNMPPALQKMILIVASGITIWVKFGAAITGFAVWVGEAIPVVIAFGTKLFALGSVVVNLVRAGVPMLALLKTASVGFLGLMGPVGWTITAVMLLATNFLGLRDALVVVVKALAEVVGMIGNTLQPVFDILADGVKGLVSEVMTIPRTLAVLIKAFNDAGKAVSEGFEKGLWSGMAGIFKAAGILGQGALDATREVLEIASPSKAYTRMGEQVTEGFAEGMRNGLEEVSRAAKEVGDEALVSSLETLDLENVNIFTAVLSNSGAAIADTVKNIKANLADMFSREEVKKGSDDTKKELTGIQKFFKDLTEDIAKTPIGQAFTQAFNGARTAVGEFNAFLTQTGANIRANINNWIDSQLSSYMGRKLNRLISDVDITESLESVRALGGELNQAVLDSIFTDDPTAGAQKFIDVALEGLDPMLASSSAALENLRGIAEALKIQQQDLRNAGKEGTSQYATLGNALETVNFLIETQNQNVRTSGDDIVSTAQASIDSLLEQASAIDRSTVEGREAYANLGANIAMLETFINNVNTQVNNLTGSFADLNAQGTQFWQEYNQAQADLLEAQGKTDEGARLRNRIQGIKDELAAFKGSTIEKIQLQAELAEKQGELWDWQREQAKETAEYELKMSGTNQAGYLKGLIDANNRRIQQGNLTAQEIRAIELETFEYQNQLTDLRTEVSLESLQTMRDDEAITSKELISGLEQVLASSVLTAEGREQVEAALSQARQQYESEVLTVAKATTDDLLVLAWKRVATQTEVSAANMDLWRSEYDLYLSQTDDITGAQIHAYETILDTVTLTKKQEADVLRALQVLYNTQADEREAKADQNAQKEEQRIAKAEANFKRLLDVMNTQVELGIMSPDEMLVSMLETEERLENQIEAFKEVGDTGSDEFLRVANRLSEVRDRIQEVRDAAKNLADENRETWLSKLAIQAQEGLRPVSEINNELDIVREKLQAKIDSFIGKTLTTEDIAALQEYRAQLEQLESTRSQVNENERERREEEKAANDARLEYLRVTGQLTQEQERALLVQAVRSAKENTEAWYTAQTELANFDKAIADERRATWQAFTDNLIAQAEALREKVQSALGDALNFNRGKIQLELETNIDQISTNLDTLREKYEDRAEQIRENGDLEGSEITRLADLQEVTIDRIISQLQRQDEFEEQLYESRRQGLEAQLVQARLNGEETGDIALELLQLDMANNARRHGMAQELAQWEIAQRQNVADESTALDDKVLAAQLQYQDARMQAYNEAIEEEKAYNAFLYETRQTSTEQEIARLQAERAEVRLHSQEWINLTNQIRALYLERYNLAAQARTTEREELKLRMDGEIGYYKAYENLLMQQLMVLEANNKGQTDEAKNLRRELIEIIKEGHEEEQRLEEDKLNKQLENGDISIFAVIDYWKRRVEEAKKGSQAEKDAAAEGLKEAQKLLTDQIKDGISQVTTQLGDAVGGGTGEFIKQLGTIANETITQMGKAATPVQQIMVAIGAAAKVVGAAFQLIADSFGDVERDSPEWLSKDTWERVGQAVTQLGSALGKLATGDWVGAIVDTVGAVISLLGDMGNGAAEIDEYFREATKGLQYFTAEGVERMAKALQKQRGEATRVSRGGILGWIGLTKEYIDEETMQFAVDLATSLDQALQQGFKNAAAGVVKGEMTLEEYREAVYDMVFDALADTLLTSMLDSMKLLEELQPLLEEFITAAISGDQKGMDDAAAKIGQKVDDFVDYSYPIFYNAGSDLAGALGLGLKEGMDDIGFSQNFTGPEDPGFRDQFPGLWDKESERLERGFSDAQQDRENAFNEGQQRKQDAFNLKMQDKENAFNLRQQAKEDAFALKQQAQENSFNLKQQDKENAFNLAQQRKEDAFKLKQEADAFRFEEKIERAENKFNRAQEKAKQKFEDRLREEEREFDRKQADAKFEWEEDQRKREDAFERDQETLKDRFNTEQEAKRRRAEEAWEARERAIDAQLEMEFAVDGQARETARLNNAIELAKEARRKELETSLRDDQDAFEEQERQEEAAFELALDTAKATRAEAERLKEKLFDDQQELDKQAFEDAQREKERNFELAQQLQEEQFEARIRKLEYDFDVQQQKQENAFNMAQQIAEDKFNRAQQVAENNFNMAQQKAENSFNMKMQREENNFNRQQQIAENNFAAGQRREDQNFQREQQNRERAFKEEMRRLEAKFYEDLWESHKETMDSITVNPIGPGENVAGTDGWVPMQPASKNSKKMKIPKFAEGGLIESPTLGIIGEAGPEIIVPLEDISDKVLNPRYDQAAKFRAMLERLATGPNLGLDNIVLEDEAKRSRNLMLDRQRQKMKNAYHSSRVVNISGTFYIREEADITKLSNELLKNAKLADQGLGE